MSSDQPSHCKDNVHQNVLVRSLFFVLGFVFVAIGIIGIITPGLPTTVFILLAAACWARSSKRFYGWLANHRLFGKMIADWQKRRAIPRYAKYTAWAMMTLSSVSSFYLLPTQQWWIAICASILCLSVAIWMYRLPDA